MRKPMQKPGRGRNDNDGDERKTRVPIRVTKKPDGSLGAEAAPGPSNSVPSKAMPKKTSSMRGAAPVQKPGAGPQVIPSPPAAAPGQARGSGTPGGVGGKPMTPKPKKPVGLRLPANSFISGSK